ncbi:MAG TPA: hypothetical protein VGH49_03765 [Xanthobacteraceae bacterium]
MVRAEYYRRQADICMRLSLLSEDKEIADLLLSKAIELTGEANDAESHEHPPASQVDGDRHTSDDC